MTAGSTNFRNEFLSDFTADVQNNDFLLDPASDLPNIWNESLSDSIAVFSNKSIELLSDSAADSSKIWNKILFDSDSSNTTIEFLWDSAAELKNISLKFYQTLLLIFQKYLNSIFIKIDC